jgi:hypothetical protein
LYLGLKSVLSRSEKACYFNQTYAREKKSIPFSFFFKRK